ncbi:MAG: FMN-binding protein [Candidatus Rifleibacteriota bacterium]
MTEKKSIFKEILSVLILSSICVGFITLTRAGIGSRSQLSDDTVKAFLEIITANKQINNLNHFEVFNRRFKMVSKGKIKLWQNEDKDHRWAFEATGPGMWGKIIIAGVIDAETSRIVGIKVIDENETAGLGSKISDPDFAQQFENLSYIPEIEVSRAKFKNNQFDAVSGATVSSKAVAALLNKTVKLIKKQHNK